MKKLFKYVSFISLASFYPAVALAQSTWLCSVPVAGARLQHYLEYGRCIISHSIVPLIFNLALLLFVWGVVQYVINPSEEAKKEKGRQFMIWGIIALTVMFSVWGLVGILQQTFGLNGIIVPQVSPTRTL